VSRRVDITPILDEAVAALRGGGFGPEAERLVAAARTAGTSSSEILGELGLAILAELRDVGDLLPRDAKRQLKRCLKEIRRTWPDIALPDDGRR
jgi:hypothetical protein